MLQELTSERCELKKGVAWNRKETNILVEVAAMPMRKMHLFKRRRTLRNNDSFLLLLAERCKNKRRAVGRSYTVMSGHKNYAAEREPSKYIIEVASFGSLPLHRRTRLMKALGVEKRIPDVWERAKRVLSIKTRHITFSVTACVHLQKFQIKTENTSRYGNHPSIQTLTVQLVCSKAGENCV